MRPLCNGLVTILLVMSRDCVAAVQVLCKVDLTGNNNGKKFAKKIKEDYRVQLIMDNLPAGQSVG